MNRKLEIRRQFLQTVKCGIGRAIIEQRKYPEIDFGKEIIKGSINCYSYDQQAEGSRAIYMNQLILEHKNTQELQNIILEKLRTYKTYWYEMDQMCDLAVLFHRNGHPFAKEILLRKFEYGFVENYGFIGREQVMEVAGIDGLLRVAKTVGKHLKSNPDDYECRLEIDKFQNQNKAINIRDILEKESKSNSNIKAYYKSINENIFKPFKRPKVKRFGYNIIRNKIEEDTFRYISEKRVSQLNTKEIELLANDFINEKKSIKKERYLRIFSKKKYPYDYKPIFELARKRNPPKTRMVEFAIGALKYFESFELREMAITKLYKKKNPSLYIPLFVSNYKVGDAQILKEVLQRSNNQNFIHSLVYGFIDIYSANRVKESKEPLELIYNSMTCGLHRKDIVEIMVKNQVLSKSIYEELKYDSEESIRKLYKKLKKQVTIDKK